MQKAQQTMLLKKFGIPESYVVLAKLQIEESLEVHRKNKQPEAVASNGVVSLQAELLDKSKNLNHIVVPERSIIPRVSLPEVQLRDAFRRELQPAPPKEKSIHERIMDEIKQKLTPKYF